MCSRLVTCAGGSLAAVQGASVFAGLGGMGWMEVAVDTGLETCQKMSSSCENDYELGSELRQAAAAGRTAIRSS